MTNRDVALQDVNKIRQGYGLRQLDNLMPGVRDHCYLCPVSRSIAYGTNWIVKTTGVTVYVLYRHSRMHNLAAATTEFIADFDEGAYEDLVCQ